MSYLLFENNGEIDINSLKFMGCSTKDGTSTIGKFGTGLKYAIAVLMRNNCKVEIFSGEKHIKFSTKKKTIQGQEFQQILVNRREIGITTSLGREWELWQAVREFYANCIDEGGEKSEVDHIGSGESGKTKVYIELENTEDIMGYFDFTGWIPSESSGLYYKEKESLSPIKIFKEGFLIYEGESYENSLFDYRMDHASINEARLLENKWEMQVNLGRIMGDFSVQDISKIIESREFNLTNSFPELGQGWMDYQEANGGKVQTGNSTLDSKLRKLRGRKNKKFRQYSGYHSTESTLVVMEELGEVVIGMEQYKVFTADFENNDNKFDFDLTKNEIYINHRYIEQQKRLLLIIEELIDNEDRDQGEFIIDLLERIYPDDTY